MQPVKLQRLIWARENLQSHYISWLEIWQKNQFEQKLKHYHSIFLWVMIMNKENE